MSQIRVSEAPVTTEISKGVLLSPLWQRWIASVGTWIANASSVSNESINCGRIGVINVSHRSPYGVSTLLSKSYPLNDTALSCSRNGIVATLKQDGTIYVASENQTELNVIISGAYILAPSQEK